MALMNWATHVLQKQSQQVAIMKIEANLETLYKFELFSATRKHEVGINSNRVSARRGEVKPKSCTYRLSQPGIFFYSKII